MFKTRRGFLSLFAQATVLVGVASSLPKQAFAAWSKPAFDADNLTQAIENRYPNKDIVDSSDIRLKAPSIAENGAVVPITVESDIPGIKSISLFAEKNPSPLVATFNFQPASVPYAKVRIRMGQTSNLIVLVETDDNIYRTQQEIKVTIGGCGG